MEARCRRIRWRNVNDGHPILQSRSVEKLFQETGAMMNLIKRLRRLSLLPVMIPAVFVAVTGCGGTSDAKTTSGSTKVSMAISGATSTISYLPTVLAKDLGYFKAEGLDVGFEEVNGGSAAATALVSGSVDVVTGNYMHTIQLQAKNQELTAFMDLFDSPSMVLAVSPKSSKVIKSIVDLRGAKVGVSSPGGSTDLLLKYLLNEAGVPPASVPVVSIGMGSAAVTAMERGQVDAAVMLDPALTILQKRLSSTSLPILVDLRQRSDVEKIFKVASVPTVVLYTTPEWLNKNAETAKKIARAETRALEWIASHSVEEIVKAVPASFAGGEPDAYLEALTQAKSGYATDPKITADGAETVLKMLQVGLPAIAKANIQLEKTFTVKYLP